MSNTAMHAAYDFFRYRSRTVGEVTAFAEAVKRYNDAVYREQASLVPAEQKARSREQMSQDMKRYWRRKKGLAA